MEKTLEDNSQFFSFVCGWGNIEFGKAGYGHKGLGGSDRAWLSRNCLSPVL